MPTRPLFASRRHITSCRTHDSCARQTNSRCLHGRRPQRAGACGVHGGTRCRIREPISRSTRSKRGGGWRGSLPDTSGSILRPPPQHCCGSKIRRLVEQRVEFLLTRAALLCACQRRAGFLARPTPTLHSLGDCLCGRPLWCPRNRTVAVDAKRVKVLFSRNRRRTPDISASSTRKIHSPTAKFCGRRFFFVGNGASHRYKGERF